MKSFPNKLKIKNTKFEFNNNYIEKCFENDSITFKPEILSELIKNSIGHDYYFNYKHYFDRLFDKCENSYYYIQISKENDYEFILNLLHNKLIDIQNIFKPYNFENDNYRFINSCLKLKALNDVEYILSLLYKLEKIGKDIDSISFKEFLKELKYNIVNTSDKNLPKSIINYSAFKFCIPEYPYGTKSGKIYSISNIEQDKNKIYIYNKNFNAIFNFIEDISISKPSDKNYELNILKNSYGVAIVLIALSVEEDIYESIIRNDTKKGESNEQTNNI